MKRIILTTLVATTLAMATMPAIADSNTTDLRFYGILREFMDHDSVTGGPTTNQPGIKLTSFMSRLGISVTESLDDVTPGLKARAIIETAMYPDAPTVGQNQTPTRSTMIGNDKAIIGFFKDGVGSIDFGRQPQGVWAIMSKYGATGDLFGTPEGEIHNRRGMRLNDAVYTQLDLGSGVTVGWQEAFSQVQNIASTNVYTAGYTYQNLNINAAYYDADNINKTSIIGASYLFPTNTKVSMIVSNDKVPMTTVGGVTPTKSATTGISVNVNQTLTEKWSVQAGTGHRDDGVTTESAGVDYKLSKAMTLQARAQHVGADHVIMMSTANELQGVAGTARTEVGLGLEWKFGN